MAEWQKYVRAFRKDLDAWAVWEPGSPVEICDYGVVEGGRWCKRGTLWEMVERTDKDEPEKSLPVDLTRTSPATQSR
jgi:hypothetical protein